ESNLVWRAASALQSRFSLSRGARIRLAKRIPSQAGLGGGSSDAAATLIALARLWEIEVSDEDLLQVAEGLGADVPFFLYGGTARGTGMGKAITPFRDVSETYFLILKPQVNISTTKAYRTLDARSLTSSD